MLSESVAQKPTIAVNEGMKTFQNAPGSVSFEGLSISGPKPPARSTIHHRSAAAITSTSGAAQFSNTRTAFMPRYRIRIWSTQNTANVRAWATVSPGSTIAPPPRLGKSLQMFSRKLPTAPPPSEV
jgi:hypothetical protein